MMISTLLSTISALLAPSSRRNSTFTALDRLEWALAGAEALPTSAHPWENPLGAGEAPPSLYEAFRAGGIVRVDGGGFDSALEALADPHTPVYQDGRVELLGRLRSQGVGGFLATRGGVAVTHPRRPLILPVPAPTILVALLDEPVLLSHRDAAEVRALLAVVSPSVDDQCATLARLSRLLADPRFLDLLDPSQPDEAILDFVWLHDCGLSNETIEIPIDLLD